MVKPQPERSRLPIRIAVSGAHGVGKTTFCFDLQKALRSHESGPYKAEVITDVARALHAQGIPINQGTEESQYALFFEKHISNLFIQSTSDYLIYDRTILDSLGYAAVNANLSQNWTHFVKTLSTYLMDRIDTYIFIPIEFALEGDGVRHTEIEFQRRVDGVMADIVRQCRVDVNVITGTRSERVGQALALVRAPQTQ
jgi:thymidylate kinase